MVLSSSRTLHFSTCPFVSNISTNAWQDPPQALRKSLPFPFLSFPFSFPLPFPILSIFPLPSWTCLICCTCRTWQYFESHQNSESKSESRRGLTLQKIWTWTPFPFDQGWVAVAWPGRIIKGRLHVEIMKYFFFFAFSKFSESLHKRKSAAATCGCYVAPFMDESLQNLRQIADIIHTCRVFTRSCLRLRSGQKKRIHWIDDIRQLTE